MKRKLSSVEDQTIEAFCGLESEPLQVLQVGLSQLQGTVAYRAEVLVCARKAHAKPTLGFAEVPALS